MGASNLAIVFGPTMVWSWYSSFWNEFLLFNRLTTNPKTKQKQKKILDVAPRQYPPWGPCNSASTTGYISSSRERHADYRFSEPHRGVPDRPPILIVDFLTKLPTFPFFDHSQERIREKRFLWINANDKNLLRWLVQLVRIELLISLSKINSLTRTITSISLCWRGVDKGQGSNDLDGDKEGRLW